jgi:hypothetical protein
MQEFVERRDTTHHCHSVHLVAHCVTIRRQRSSDVHVITDIERSVVSHRTIVTAHNDRESSVHAQPQQKNGVKKTFGICTETTTKQRKQQHKIMSHGVAMQYNTYRDTVKKSAAEIKSFISAPPSRDTATNNVDDATTTSVTSMSNNSIVIIIIKMNQTVLKKSKIAH